MRSLERRLGALERRTESRHVVDGLGHFYAVTVAMEPAGGAEAMLARHDVGALVEGDVAVLAAIPGGLRELRSLVASLTLFYPADAF